MIFKFNTPIPIICFICYINIIVIKFFSNEITTNNKFKLENDNIYFVGDGAGKAGNIVAAAATGLVAARDILEKYN